MRSSVGYRINSKRGAQFRIWATQVLRDHLVQGYTANQRRVAVLQKAIQLVTTGVFRAIETRASFFLRLKRPRPPRCGLRILSAIYKCAGLAGLGDVRRQERSSRSSHHGRTLAPLRSPQRPPGSTTYDRLHPVVRPRVLFRGRMNSGSGRSAAQHCSRQDLRSDPRRRAADVGGLRGACRPARFSGCGGGRANRRVSGAIW